MVLVNFFYEKKEKLPFNKVRVRLWLKDIIKKEEKELGCINFIYCSDEYLLDLNKSYLKHNSLTDVITFNFSENKNNDLLFSKFPENITSLQWHSYEVQELENNRDVTLIASSSETKFQIFKYKNHAYGIQFHIEIKNTTVGEWGCVPEYKSALENQLGPGALDKFDQQAKVNMPSMNKYSQILYNNFKKLVI